MGISRFVNSGRPEYSRASLLYCPYMCGPKSQVLGVFQKDGWNSTINPYGTMVSSRVATYVALVNDGFGGRPTWSIPVQGSRFGKANPPGYNPGNYLNQYGRLKRTGGQPLRNF
jgi:hypothetical protein